MAGKDAPRAWLEIDGQCISRNARRILSHIHPLQMLAVLKANAYGLGVETVASLLKNAGAHAFGVAEIDAAQKLKRFDLPIHLMGDFLPREAGAIARAISAMSVSS